MPLRVAIVYTVEATDHKNAPNQHGAEQQSSTTLALENAITELGHETHLVPGDLELLVRLKHLSPDVVFNNCTGINDKSSQPQFAGR